MRPGEFDWLKHYGRLQALGEPVVQQLGPHAWRIYLRRVDLRISRHVLSTATGFGPTPMAAVESLWWTLTENPGPEIVIDNGRPAARTARWTGTEWEFYPVQAGLSQE